MPKPSAMLTKLNAQCEAKYAALFRQRMGMLMQLCCDCAVLAAHDVLGMGPGLAKAFLDEMKGNANEIAARMLEDVRDDPEFVYTKEKIDQQLRAICGECFEPWEVRYGE